MVILKGFKKEVLLFFTIILLSSSVLGAMIYVPGNYTTITDAIGNASNGDIINVSAGIYTENLVVDRRIDLIGEDAATTTINGVHIINNSFITIDGFTLAPGAGTAITLDSSNSIITNIVLTNNIFDLTTSPSVGIYLGGGTPTNQLLGISIKYNTFNGPANQICNPWKVGGSFGSPLSCGVNGLDFEHNSVNKCSIPINLQDSNLNDLLINNNTFRDTNGTIYIWTQNGSAPAGVLSNFVFINNDVDSTNSYGVAFFDSDLGGGDPGDTFTDANFGLGNRINYNDFVGIVGSYGLQAVNISANLSTYVLDSEYNWWGSANGPGGAGPGNGSGVSVGVDFTPWVGVSIDTKSEEPSCVFSTDNLTLYANISSGLCIGNVTFGVEIGGIWTNYSGSISTSGIGNYTYTIRSGNFSGSQSIRWTVYSDDCYNHTIQNGIRTVYINSRSNLSVVPAIPDGLNNLWYVSYPTFTLTNLDLGGGDMWYRWDAAQEFLYLSPFSIEDIPNQPNISAGTLELNYFSDICSNESEQQQIFYIDLISPQFTQFTPDNGSTINSLRPDISVYLDEIWQSNSGINLSTVVMGVDGIVVNASIGFADTIDALASYTPSADLSYGWHNVSIYAKDNAGWGNQTNWTFNISQVPIITLNISSPLNNTYYDTRRILVNVSTDREADMIEYLDLSDRRPRWRRLCRNCDSYTRLKSFRDRKFNETLGYAYSWHNLTIKATNGYGSSEHNISFFVDTKKPRVSRTLPRRRKIVNGSYFYVRYSEDNLQQVNLVYGNNNTGYRETNISNCSSGRNKDCFTSVNLSDYHGEEIEFWFNLTDFVRTKSSRTTEVSVDTVSPVLNISDPNNATYGRYVYFNISVSEKVRYLEYYDLADSHPRWRRLCSNCEEYGNNRVRKKYFRRGTHNITIRARDYAENSDEEIRNFVVSY